MAKSVDDITTCLRLKLALYEIFLALELRFPHIIFLDLALLELFVIYGLLTFQQLQSHISSPQVARHTDKVGIPGAFTIYDIILLSLTDAGDGYSETCSGRCGVASHDIDVPLAACHTQSLIELLDILHDEAF